jgi:hypothetical protein
VTRKRQPTEEAEEFFESAELLPAAAPEVSQRRAPDRSPAFLRITPPADSSEGEGRAYMMPFTPDRERIKRFIRGATDTRGIFPIEIRNKNQSIIGRDSIEVEPDHGAQPYASAQHASGAQPTPQYASQPSLPQSSSDAAQVLTSFADSFVAINKVAKDNTPTPAPPLDVERLISGVAEAVKASQPAPTPDPTENLVKTVNTLKTLGLFPEKNETPPAQTAQAPNMFENYRAVKEQMRELAEEFAPPEENQGVVSQVLKLFDTGLKTVDRTLSSPTGQRLAGALLSRYMQGAPPPAMQPPSSQPQPGPDAQSQGEQAQTQAQQPQLPAGVVSASRALTREVTRDDVEKGADIVESLINSEPAMAFELQQLFELPSVSLVEWLANVTGAPYLLDLPHSVRYFDSLKEELRERAEGEQDDEDESEPASEVNASTNGHKASAAPVS